MIRVLHILYELDGGGVERLLYDYFTHINTDNIMFDFVLTSPKVGIIEETLTKMGCQMYHIARVRDGISDYCHNMQSILQRNKYDIVHCHEGYKSYFALSKARDAGIKNRIAHAHQANMPETLREKIERKIFTPLTKLYATNLFACGEDAAKWMWGENAFNSGKVHIMRNAIDTKQFAFSEEKRRAIRKELGIENKFVIGNVARFAYQKNHEFLIEIFAEVKKLRSDAVLMLVGRGELEEEVRAQVKELGLEEDVLFLGVRNDVPDLLNAMDVFVLPSRFEGLPVTLVEVQCNGLPAVASDNITREIKLAGNVEYLSLTDSEKVWAEKIISADNARIGNGVEVISASGYDIETEAEKMKRKYYELLKGCSDEIKDI